MLSIAVCDDIIPECADLARQISDLLQNREIPVILKRFYSGKELLTTAEAFDILFLDIKMPGLNGMDLAKALREKGQNFILIFITAVREYVFEAYEVEAFHYLIKPVKKQKLEQVLFRAIEKTRVRHTADFILVSSQRNARKIWLKDIVYIEAMGRTVKIQCIQDMVETYEQIGILEDKLKEKDFFRCHKGFLINLRFVDTFNRTQIRMENGDTVLLAKRRYDAFAKELLRYMKKEGGIL